MNDYSFPCPDGLHYISEPDDIEAYSSSVGHRLPYQEQLKVISTLKNELGEEVMFWDTVFNPWFTIRRHLLFKDINLYMRMHGTLLHKMLDEVTDCLINYIHKSFENGVKGIYFSVPASESFISYNDFREFMLPYDLKLIESVKHLGILFLHIHGAGNIYYNDLFSQYHYNGVSWADQTTNLSLVEGRKLTDRVVMGGIDETHDFNYRPYKQLKQEVHSALAQMKGTPFILAPGCVLQPQCPAERLHYFFECAKEQQNRT